MNGTSLLAKEIAEELARILAPLIAKELNLLPAAPAKPAPAKAAPTPPQPTSTRPVYVDEYQVAETLSISVSTVRRWRLLRQGPPYKKIGSSVRYSRAELDVWIADQDKHY